MGLLRISRATEFIAGQMAASVIVCTVLMIGAAHAGESYKAERAELDAAWLEASSFLVSEANRRFVAAKGLMGTDELERELGDAVTLLNVQPRTRGNIEKARIKLERLSGNRDNGEIAIFATYFLARLHEMHAQPPRLKDARTLYHRLLEEYPGNPIADRSASSLVLIDLYENISSEERARRFAALESLAPRLQSPSGKRDYHLNLGNAYIQFSEMERSRARAIFHLLTAEKEGITRWQTEAATWVSIGELARVEGRNELAAEYYKKFLAKYPRDNRHYTIKKRLEALSSGD